MQQSMMSFARLGAAFAALTTLTGAARAQSQSNGQPVEVPWNSNGGKGPDGPWNYISLNVGSQPSSSVDFYPIFGSIQSFVVRSDACTANNICLQPTPGYYNAVAQSAQNSDQNVNASISPLGGDLVNQQGQSGTGYFWTDSMTNNDNTVGGDDIAMYVLPNITQKYGNKAFVPLSLLSMEPNVTDIKGGENPVKTPSGNANQFTLLEHYTNNTGGSSTMAIHMGAAGFNQPGSLVFGGYDQNRLIERPAIFNNLGTVSLMGLSFGTTTGLSPWQNTPNVPGNFLGANKINVLLSPHVATIQLPQPVCNLMAQYLPINYDPDTALYLWNTSSPSYHDIISSPSYLNFTFGDSGTTSIRVPFAALNLNLTQPIKDSPTPYFPCDAKSNTANLGRAFLQSAFLMQAWNSDPVIYVGQAPGPMNLPTKSSLQPLSQNNPNAAPAQNPPKWEDTWSNLKPLSSASTITPTAVPASASSSAPAGNNNNNNSGGLSGGAIAGVVIGVLLGVGAIASIAAFFLWRRRREQQRRQTELPGSAAGPNGPYPGAAYYGAQSQQGEKKFNPLSPATPGTMGSSASGLPAYPTQEAQEIDSGRRYEEADAARTYHEMDSHRGNTGFRYEMADTSGPVEMGAGHAPR